MPDRTGKEIVAALKSEADVAKLSDQEVLAAISYLSGRDRGGGYSDPNESAGAPVLDKADEQKQKWLVARGTDIAPEVWEAAETERTKRQEAAKKIPEEAAKAAQTGDTQGLAEAADTDGDGKLSDEEKAAAEEAAGVEAGLFGDLQPGPPLPDWVVTATGGVKPSEEQQQVILQQINATTGKRYDSLAEVPQGPLSVEIVHQATGTVDPQAPGGIVEIFGPGGSVKVDLEALSTASSVYGIDVREFPRLVNLAKKLGLTDATGNPAWQVLAALQKSNPPTKKSVNITAGQSVEITDTSSLEAQAESYSEGIELYGSPTLAFLHATDPEMAERLAASAKTGQPGDKRDLRKAEQAMLNAGWDPQALASMGLAVDSIDTALTDIANASGNPEDRPTVTATLPDEATVNEAMRALWTAWFPGMEPSEDQMDDFRVSVEGAILEEARAQGSQMADLLEQKGGDAGWDLDDDGILDHNLVVNRPVDWQSRMQQEARKTPEYQRLYGNKPTGMAESEYQEQFRSGWTDIRGQEAADPAALQAGMQSGDYQTTVGAASMDPGALNNSTFMGRLARAATIVSANT